MSVANILDPTTGLIRSEYLSPASTFPPVEVRDWSYYAQNIVVVNPGGPAVVVPNTSTNVSSGELYSISGFAQITSSQDPPAGNMALYVSLTGSGVPILLPILNGPESTFPGIVKGFQVDVSIPPTYTNFSLMLGNGGTPNLGTITAFIYETFITKVEA